MGKPTNKQFDIATAWLRANEGDEVEAGACKAVADWIDEFSYQQFLRSKARQAGVPVAALRRKLSDLKFETI